jgi:hypothetical protein
MIRLPSEYRISVSTILPRPGASAQFFADAAASRKITVDRPSWARPLADMV